MQEIISGCPYDCGGSCPLKVYVEDGEIKRIAPEEGPDSPSAPLLRPCARGLANAQRVYHPDRLRYPLKRIGERGEGRFQRVSWDEALDIVAGEMRRISDAYGPEAILKMSGAGATDGLLHRPFALADRFFNVFGGYTATRASLSFEGARFAALHSFGFSSPPPGPESLLRSNLVIMWGFNPSETIFGTNTNYLLALARERGTKFVFVDPRFTDSTAALADRWIPILPGTDTAMLLAMATVILQERLYDESYVRRYVYGFESFRDYCLGAEDGVPKTPNWAEKICQVRAEVIADLAREFAATRPADLRGGWGPGRTVQGEQFHRACIALAAITGNIGVPGGGPGCWVGQDFSATLGVSSLPTLANPGRKSIIYWRWAEAVLQGTAGGYPSDIRMIYSLGGNRFNQCADVNKGVRALKKVDFVVVQDLFLTPMARFADVVLAANSHFEREDVQIPHNQGHYLIYNHKVTESLPDTKSDLDILAALAQRLGPSEKENFGDKTEREWLGEFLSGAPVDVETLSSQGVYRYRAPLSGDRLEEFILDPEKNPLLTPSGKIELFSQRLAQRNHPQLPPVPQYFDWGRVESRESRDGVSRFSTLDSRLPTLLLVTTHSRKRVNSTLDNLPWLRELEPHAVWINAADARVRGIKDGEQVKVFNEVGTVIIEAKVTERIMPGVVSIDQGAWWQPDDEGRDRGGCVNSLCPDAVSAGEAAATNAVWVEVARWED